MIVTLSIPIEQARVIESIEEGHFGDAKAIEVKPSKLTETVSAFANASGGEIFVGLDEHEVNGVKTHSWRGFIDAEAANAHIQTIESMKPLGGHFSATFLRSPARP